MIEYSKISKYPVIFLSFTGMTIPEFQMLLDKFSSAYREYEQKLFVKGKDRIRRFGGGDNPTLALDEDKLLFILTYYKLYPIQQLQGFLFSMSQSSANEWIHRLSQVLEMTLECVHVLPKRKVSTMDELISICPVLEFFVDGVEREIQRSGEYEEQKGYFSGKKKMHSIKNLVIADREKHIVLLTSTHNGKTHDKKLLDDAHIPWPKDSQAMLDLGFVGYAHPNLQIIMPTKKPKGKELSQQQKNQNRIVSSIRIGVEHAIGGVKRNHIVHDIFRNHKEGFADKVMYISAGLHNMRIDARKVTQI